MGQYYKPYLKDVKTGEITVFCSHDYNSGSKLMEHSWLSDGGNSFLNAACNAILNRPSIVAWVGDYSEYEEDYHLGAIEELGEAHYTEIIKLVWKNEGNHSHEYSDVFNYQKNRYLINNTTQEYIDFVRTLDENDADGWVVHPLSLITATSNGKGGGDYYKKNPDIDLVGNWAFHELYISDTKPDSYCELIVEFME